MIPPHLFYQIYLSFLGQNDCTPPKCGELSEYTDSAHTEVEDLSSRYVNGSDAHGRLAVVLVGLFLVLGFCFIVFCVVVFL